jgi:hypothetical protein
MDVAGQAGAHSRQALFGRRWRRAGPCVLPSERSSGGARFLPAHPLCDALTLPATPALPQIAGTMMPSVIGAGGHNMQQAKSHMQDGERHWNAKSYKLALDSFKAAGTYVMRDRQACSDAETNAALDSRALPRWFFKAGDRKLSDHASSWARKSRAALIEEEVRCLPAFAGITFCFPVTAVSEGAFSLT